MIHRPAFRIACSLLILALAPLACTADTSEPWREFTTDWRAHAVWDDGKAERAVYDATRPIYGEPRDYRARIFTNTEHASPETFTKSDAPTERDRHVFKHHLREDIPTDNYDYHFSTMSYLGVADLKSLKLDMGVQEDCGATFKQYVNHADTLRWRQFSYFPDEGQAGGEYDPPAALVFEDALALVLRGYPFDDPPDTLTLALLPSQRSNRWSPHEPEPWQVRYHGRQTLSLPVGEVEAHHLRLTPAAEHGTTDQPPAHDFWFAAEGDYRQGEAGLHVMVRYHGPAGQRYELRAIEREAYWQR